MARAMEALNQEEWPEAEERFQRVIREQPHLPAAWHYCGLVQHLRKNSEAGLRNLEQALRLDPRNVTYLSNTGKVLLELHQYETAIDLLWKAHELDPDHAQLLVQLVTALLAIESGNKIIPEIKRHLQRAPTEWRLWLFLADCYEQGGDRENAEKAFSRAIELAPESEYGPRLKRAETRRKREQLEEAAGDFESVLEIDPDSGPALIGLANICSTKGDFEKSRTIARKALQLNPDLHAGWYLLAGLRETDYTDQFVSELEEAARRAEDAPTAWLVHFALGKARESRKEYDAAFKAYEAGNDMRLKFRPYSTEWQNRYAKLMFSNLDRTFMANADGIGINGLKPIFVCGMPRSGTTLVETILASHQDVSPGGEMTYIHNRLKMALGTRSEIEKGVWLGERTPEELHELAEAWALHLESAAKGNVRITDKMPGNYQILGLIKACFPDAKIVLLRRNPMDNCFSCFATPFAEGHNFSFSLERLGHYYQIHELFISHWKRALGEDSIYELSYETLAENPEASIAELLEAVELPWDANCLQFHETHRNVSTASVFQVRQKMYTRSIERWRHYEQHLSPLKDALAAPIDLQAN